MALKKMLLLFVAVLLLATSCRKESTVEIKQDGAAVSVSIPENATSADLINLQTALSNTLTIKAERERMAFEFAEAKLRKSERQFYFFFGVFAVVAGIVSVFAIACFFFFWQFGGRKA